jgi:purine-nucleoside phosphorylase
MTSNLNPTRVVVVIHDHLALPNLTGLNPLIGPVLTPTTPRFIPLSNAYSRSLRRMAFKVYMTNAELSFKLTLAEGTYAWVTGPTYETSVEGRFLSMAGADVVGASTVPEVLVAREEGMEVLVLSLVTNRVVMAQKESVKAEVEAGLVSRSVRGQILFTENSQISGRGHK